jgi:hypothetical protein
MRPLIKRPPDYLFETLRHWAANYVDGESLPTCRFRYQSSSSRKAIALNVPATLLAHADEVIE